MQTALWSYDVIVLIAEEEPKVAHSPSWTNCGKEVSVSHRRGTLVTVVIRGDPDIN